MEQEQNQEESVMIEQQELITAFKQAMVTHNISPPDDIYGDGRLYRFHIEGDKAGTRNGWYVLHMDLTPQGVFGSWKTGICAKWSAKKTMSWQAQLLVHELIAQKQKQQEAMIRQAQLAAAAQCEVRWQGHQIANPSHPYLVKKQIKPYCAKQTQEMLVLPIVDVDGKLWSLQYITPAGQKVLYLHGAKKGHFIPVHNHLQKGIKILICEGFATGASLAALEPEACVIAAIDAGNLVSVAMAIRVRWPDNDMVICADDDRTQIQNVGLMKAEFAAKQARARVVKPLWPEEVPLELSDFNDWVCWLNQHGELPCIVRF